MRKRYIRRRYTVEAEQWTGHNLNDDDSLFQDARVIIRNDGEQFIVSVRGATTKVANKGDWLVKFNNGDLETLRNELFEAHFEPVIEHTTFDPAKGTDEPA